MSANDYQAGTPSVSYEPATPAERLVTEQLAKTRHNLGAVDITHDAPVDELPD